MVHPQTFQFSLSANLQYLNSSTLGSRISRGSNNHGDKKILRDEISRGSGKAGDRKFGLTVQDK